MIDSKRRSELRADYVDWVYQLQSFTGWTAFVAEKSRTEVEGAYLQGLKDRDAFSELDPDGTMGS